MAAAVQQRKQFVQPTVNAPDARTGALWTLTLTLGAGVHTITVPDYAQGFQLIATTTDCYFAVNEDPAAAATSSSATITATSTFSVGGTAPASTLVRRYFEPVRNDDVATGRPLRLKGTNGNTVKIELF